MPRQGISPSFPLTRRELLCGASAVSLLALIPRLGHARAASLDVDAFLTLSEKQLGRTDLPREMAAGMLSAFSAMGREDALAALAAGRDDPDLAGSIVASWYTGASPDPDAAQTLGYTDALIWEAMDYTKPLAWCGGAMGHWAEPPEA